MNLLPNKNSIASLDGLTAKVAAIDANCPIYKSGAGYCWAPAHAWGKTEKQLCECCWRKHSDVRVCSECGKHCLNPELWDFKRRMCLTCAKEKKLWSMSQKQSSIAVTAPTPVQQTRCSSSTTLSSAEPALRSIRPILSAPDQANASSPADACEIPTAASEETNEKLSTLQDDPRVDL